MMLRIVLHCCRRVLPKCTLEHSAASTNVRCNRSRRYGLFISEFSNGISRTGSTLPPAKLSSRAASVSKLMLACLIKRPQSAVFEHAQLSVLHDEIKRSCGESTSQPGDKEPTAPAALSRQFCCRLTARGWSS